MSRGKTTARVALDSRRPLTPAQLHGNYRFKLDIRRDRRINVRTKILIIEWNERARVDIFVSIFSANNRCASFLQDIQVPINTYVRMYVATSLATRPYKIFAKHRYRDMLLA